MSHTYKKNYLKQVIFRADFENITLSNFESLKTSLATDFDDVKKLKGRQGNLEVKFDSGEVTNSTQEVEIWQFVNSKTGNKFEVGPTHCLLEYFSYKDSTDLKNDVSKLCEDFLEKNEVTNILRIGLRYINEIDPQSVKKISDWSKYITADLFTYSDFLKQKDKTATRMLNQIEMKTNDCNIVFKYGIWNNKYPSPITSSPFVIDIDGFTRLPVEFTKGELTRVASEINKEVENLFEIAITDNLRKEMDK